MNDRNREPIHNRLLRALPSATLERLLPALHPVATARGESIDHVDGAIEHLYFVNRGLVSMVKTMRDGRSVEVGAVGIEGLTDPSSLLGLEPAVLEALVQVPGRAFRISLETLRRETAADAALRQYIQRYARFAFGQLAQTAACNRLHSMEERCCRWLLIAHDSALAESFPLTHEFLAMMLGVQRSGVSVTSRFLKKAGLIDYTRGQVRVLSRDGLEEAACECYGTRQDELSRLFAPARQRRSPAG